MALLRDSPRTRRAAAAGMILDDMFQPLSIIRRDTDQSLIRMLTSTNLAARIGEEFNRKVRTLAGISSSSVSRRGRLLRGIQFSFSLSRTRSCVSWCLTFGSVAYLRIALSSGSLIFAAFAALQIFGWAIAILACVTGFPCCIVSRRRPARCSYSKRPPLSDSTICLHTWPLWKI